MLTKSKNSVRLLFYLAFGLFGLGGCEDSPRPADSGREKQSQNQASTQNSLPSRITVDRQQEILATLPFDDQRDFQEADRGLVVAAPDLVVRHAVSNQIIWDIPAYDFIEGKAPSSVNPSLWRQAKLNAMAGLYKVKEGIWQLRNFDLATISIIQGKTGWIVVDPNTSTETGKAAHAFLEQHLFAGKPVSAVIFTHSHIDHFGGATAYLDDEDYQNSRLPIVAPAGFTEEAASENIMLGSSMSRRAGYQYGKSLTPGPFGSVDLGLGKSVPFGIPSLLVPNTLIEKTGETLTLDGVEFIFQIASGTEAPAELTFYLPEHKAFCGAEVVSRTMHNIYTLRGAKVRDALLWSEVIDDILLNYGTADVVFNSHHWPIWGAERIREFLESQRDVYKFIHDQSVHLILQGHTPNEIANTIKLPDSLSQHFFSRGYYGTLAHNAKAIYQHYVGWYDGNPANLHPLPTAQTAAKYMQLMGGIDAVVEAAQIAYEKGEYQWVAELLNKAVFAHPEHSGAKSLLANSYDQMAYQAESGPWRSEYLSAAHELRNGITSKPMLKSDMLGVLQQTPIETFLKTMAVGVDVDKSEGKALVVELSFSDLDQQFVLVLRNSVLHYYSGLDIAKLAVKPTATLTLSKALFLQMVTNTVDLKAMLLGDDLSYEGSLLDLLSFFRSFSQPSDNFAIVTP